MTGPCPGQDRLERMLLDELAPEESGPIEDHVADCFGCREVLEDLTRAASTWEPTGTMSAAPDFLRRLGASPPATLPTRPAAPLMATAGLPPLDPERQPGPEIAGPLATAQDDPPASPGARVFP